MIKEYLNRLIETCGKEDADYWYAGACMSTETERDFLIDLINHATYEIEMLEDFADNWQGGTGESGSFYERYHYSELCKILSDVKKEPDEKEINQELREKLNNTRTIDDVLAIL